MPLYEYYCVHCHGIFEEIRQIRDASAGAACPECDREAPRIMSTFQAFTMRDGYPRKIPDKGTYWHMGKEVKKRARRMTNNQHPELVKPAPPRKPTKAERERALEMTAAKRAGLLYRDKWGINEHGFRSVKAKKIKPERKTL
jgi:putative FmdB family regulatory protein